MKINKFLIFFSLILILSSFSVFAINSTVIDPAQINVNAGTDLNNWGANITINSSSQQYSLTKLYYVIGSSTVTRGDILTSSGTLLYTSTNISGGVVYFPITTILQNNTPYLVTIYSTTNRSWTTSLAGRFPKVDNNVTWTSMVGVNVSNGVIQGTATDRVMNLYGVEYFPLSLIYFISPTPENNFIKLISDNNFTINTLSNWNQSANTTHNVYFSNGSLFVSYSNNSNNFSSNIVNLSVGAYLYNATIYNGSTSYSTETRTIIFRPLFNITSPLNNSNISAYNFSVSLNNTNFTLYNYSLYFNNTYISRFSNNNISVNLLNYGNWSLGFYNFSVFESNSLVNISNTSGNIYLKDNAILNVIGWIANYSVRDLDSDNVYSTTGANLLNIGIIKNQLYRFRLEKNSYAYLYFNVTTTSNEYNYTSPALNLSNSIFVLCYNESSANRILANSSFTLTNLDSSSIVTNSTVNNCAFNYSLLVAGRYELEIDPVGFSARKFQLTVSDRASQSLNAYLLDDSLSSAIGMYVRSNLGNVLENVNVNIYRWVNGSFVSVSNDNTDVSGFVQFYLRDGINYRIILSYPLFVTNDFTFTPYLANSPYNFVLSQNISSDFPNVFNNVTFAYSKSNFTLSNSSNYTFYLYTNSVGGALVFSNISCPSFSLQDSNPSGALLSQSVDVSGLSSFNCTFSFRTSLMNSTYSWISFFKVYTPSNSSLIGSLPQISDEVGNRGWMTILAYFIIVFAVIVVARMTSDPRVIGFVILSGIVLFVFVGWIGYLVGGITATIGFFLMFMGGR